LNDFRLANAQEVDVEDAKRFFSVLEKSLTGHGFAFVVPTNFVEVHSLVFEPGFSEVEMLDSTERFRAEVRLCIARHIKEMTEECLGIVSEYCEAQD
jgi:hypothetical protein